MKIAVSATGSGLEAEVEPRFGRCPYFIIVDTDTMKFEVMDNSSAMAAGGAGISAGQMVANKGVQAVLTGNCGPNAYQVLSAAGIQIVTGVSGKVRDAVEAYKFGNFQATSQPTVGAHFGMGGGGGLGVGGGMGHGMGRGKGMGMGAGMMPGAVPMAQQPSPGLELEALQAQLQGLTQQLADVKRRIDELEKK